MNAGVPVIDSRMRSTLGRTACRGPALLRPGGFRGAGEVEQVQPLGLVELQGTGHGAENLVGYAADVPFL